MRDWDSIEGAPHGDGRADGATATEWTAPAPRAGEPVPRDPDEGAAERVVFGVDFSPASLSAARWVAGRLGTDGVRRRLDACVAHVVPWPDGVAALGVAADSDRLLHELRPALLGGLAGFAASLRLERVRPVLRVGRPSSRLAELAAQERARLLVLGRRRDAARQRIGEPNVIERVTRRSACDVLVVPEGAPGAIEHVVAAVDVGPSAELVAQRATALAQAHGAALTLVHVLSPSHGSYDRLARRRRRAASAPPERAPSGETAYRDAAYAWLAWLARDARPSMACRLAVPVGDAGREILELATKGEPAVVVVGKRGADGAPHGSVGSVARELVARSSSPVLALDGAAPRPWRAS